MIKVSRLQASYDLVLSREARWMIPPAGVHPDYRGSARPPGKSIPINSAAFCPAPASSLCHSPLPPNYVNSTPPAIETRLKSGPSVFPVCSSTRCCYSALSEQLFDSQTQQLATAPRHYSAQLNPILCEKYPRPFPLTAPTG